MYEKSDAELDRILNLVEKCPEALRAKAFEILLEGYVKTLLPQPATSHPSAAGGAPPPPPGAGAPLGRDSLDQAIPAEVQARLQAIAKRRNTSAKKLADIFDFSTDPFGFAPIHVPGDKNADRTRKVALLVATRSFLASARWVADWSEIKAMCTHQACYDLPNFSKVLTNAQGSLFKKVNRGVSVELSAEGITEAENLLATLAVGTNAAEE